ncbi:glycosyltransferase family 2 protein [Candidatus Methylocalor cossyra]|uniref:Glycosyltransferase n=1 Tax=Candidatus Methylocalor cossyra TaxID=3108543 RepID=A0ABP1C9C2_9GAMM
MSQEIVTVLMPVYNAERYLRETLTSVSAQTLDQFEILVVDDGSTDRSAEILEDYRAHEPRLRILRQPNGGISAALNAGLRAAKGTLIARMDADDLMFPQRLERQRDFLAAHPELGFCASFMEMIDATGRTFGEYCPGPLTTADLQRQMALRQAITYTHPTVMYRTALVRRLGGYDPSYEPCEDMELFGRMILSGFPGLVIPEKLLKYRVHRASISGSKAALQVRIQDYVRRAFYARLTGDSPLSRTEFERQIASLPIVQRLVYESDVWFRAYRQMATYCRAERRWAELLTCLTAAALLRPRKGLRYAAAMATRVTRTATASR